MKKIFDIEIPSEQFDFLMCEQTKGKELKVVDGKVVAIERFVTEKEKAIIRISALKNLLKEQDFQTIKYIQGKLSQEKFNVIVAQCEEWRKEINDLEEKYDIK